MTTADLADRCEQILDGPFPHSRHSIEPVAPLAQANDRGEEADGCPGIATEQLGRGGRDHRFGRDGLDGHRLGSLRVVHRSANRVNEALGGIWCEKHCNCGSWSD